LGPIDSSRLKAAAEGAFDTSGQILQQARFKSRQNPFVPLPDPHVTEPHVEGVLGQSATGPP